MWSEHGLTALSGVGVEQVEVWAVESGREAVKGWLWC